MTTLPPIQTWFNSLDWNLSFYDSKYRNCDFEIQNSYQTPSIKLSGNGEWHKQTDSIGQSDNDQIERIENEPSFPPQLIEAMNASQPSLDETTGITDDNRSLRGRLQKSTSLKTRKPETKCEPQRRKSVRFADSVGLDLECVRLFENGKPTVPTSAFSDLKISDDDKNRKNSVVNAINHWSVPYRSPSTPKLTLDFVEPFSCVDFIDRVRRQKVSLQSCFISSHGPNVNITCILSVVNVSFEKRVLLRYTSDYWQTYTEIEAKYVPNSSNGWSDKFVAEFIINTESSFNDISPGKQILFAIRYVVDGGEYWDNNMGLNYSLSARL